MSSHDNPILDAFRFARASGNTWNDLLDGHRAFDYRRGWRFASDDQIAQASNVLGRLASVTACTDVAK